MERERECYTSLDDNFLSSSLLLRVFVTHKLHLGRQGPAQLLRLCIPKHLRLEMSTDGFDALPELFFITRRTCRRGS